MQLQLSPSDWASIVLVVSIVTSILKAILEQATPGFRPNDKTHDSLLILLNLVLCLGLTMWTAASRHALAPDNLEQYVIWTIESFAGSQTLYKGLTALGQSVNSKGAGAGSSAGATTLLAGLPLPLSGPLLNSAPPSTTTLTATAETTPSETAVIPEGATL